MSYNEIRQHTQLETRDRRIDGTRRHGGIR